MKRMALTILAALTAALAAAEDSDPGIVTRHTDIRKEILSGFVFSPPSRDSSLPPPLLAEGTSLPDATDVVRMAPFSVREPARLDELHQLTARKPSRSGMG
jgi:hypothetical protein